MLSDWIIDRVGFGGFLIVAFALGALLVQLMAAYSCHNIERMLGSETKMMPFDACYIQHEGEWMRYDAYEKVIIARDGLGNVGK